MIGLEITNPGAFFRMATDAKAMEADIRNAIRDMTREYKAEVARLLSRTGTGKRYRLRSTSARWTTVREKVKLFGGKTARVTRRRQILGPFQGGTYNASAPGQPPAQFTGNMARSLTTVFRASGMNAKVKVGRFRHRHLLEFGTKPRYQKTYRGKALVHPRYVGSVSPRPVWSPLQKRAWADLERRILRVIDATIAFRGGGA